MPQTFVHSKTGYVQSYLVDLFSTSTGNIYCQIVISDDELGSGNPETWVLVNRKVTGDWAVTFSNLSQAVIATIKEALLTRKKVLFTGRVEATEGSKPELFCVTIWR